MKPNTQNLLVGIFTGVALVGCVTPERPFIEHRPGTPDPTLNTSLSLDPRIETAATSARPLLPIMGGTLLVTRDDQTAVVADPDRDRVVLVDLVSRRPYAEVRLPEGAIPGRIVEDGDGRVHVILRGTGEVLSFQPRNTAGAQRHSICEEPRGIAFDETSDTLHVTCRDGLLLTLNTAGEVIESLQSDSDDLRDIVRIGSQSIVTRFRSAELQRVSSVGNVMETQHALSGSVTGFDGGRGAAGVQFVPRVAWRLARGNGMLALAHQVHQEGSQEIPVSTPGAYGGGGGGDGCESGGIVRSRVTVFDEEMNILATHALAGATLPVDVALSNSGLFAVVAAGEQGSNPSVSVGPAMGFTCGGGLGAAGTGIQGPIAVAFTNTSQLVVQQRDPAVLWLDGVAIPLGGEERFDAGHAIFHGNAGVGLACASCHPEGGEDGHVWSFTGFGSLRTPALHGGMTQTAPFHWNGDLPTMHDLMDEIFEGRMGGPAMDIRQENALAGWVDALPRSRGREGLEVAAVERGSRLFFGEAQCGSCHNGEMLTNNQTIDVGTGGPLQVPTLVGVSLRLPVMHTGCATTLEARFDPSCGGGEAHGHTAQLSAAERSDLITFLESL
jgi:DNA-binding beta-propeller fold protein YncE